MSNPNQDKLTGHEYDGICEYDNPTPAWWTWLFILSVIFSVGYWLVYHIGTEGVSVAMAYQASVAENARIQFAALGDVKPDEPTILRLMADKSMVAAGQKSFAGLCVACHGAQANGLVGPNLTDDYYKNIKELSDIPKVISEGAANGAMPAWKTRLAEPEIVLLSAYVASLRGQNIPGPRPAEGVIIPPWPAAPATANNGNR
jgi:cytochrome c oxidase cbb3-type subunit 3